MKVMANALMPQRILFLMMQVVVMPVVDYGLGLLTLSKTQVGKLAKSDNSNCTRLHQRHTNRMHEAYPRPLQHWICSSHHVPQGHGNGSQPLHPALRQDRGSRIKRGQSWMAQAVESLVKVCASMKAGNGFGAQELAPNIMTKVIIGVRKCDVQGELKSK